MKKPFYSLLLAVVMAGSFVAGLLSNHTDRPKAATETRKVLYYVDPMNPAHTSSVPGLAPCGMKMEPVYAEESPAPRPIGGAPQVPGAVTISTEKQQIAGIRTAAVQESPMTGTIRALGRVAPDETRIFRVNAATDGWIRRALPVTTGSVVKKDELLATFYAPEFFTAMKAYLYGLRSKERFQRSGHETKEQLDLTDANIENYRNGLRNLGMTERQLDEIMKGHQGGEYVEIRAPEAGFVLVRNVTDGERFQKGAELYRIADLSRVWVLADVFGNESRYFRPGIRVKVTQPGQDMVFRARVADVAPQFDPGTRALKVRLEVENTGHTLRPDMFVDVEAAVSSPSSLTVPAEAILDSGLSKTVFIDRGNGLFEPRAVETGARLGGRVAITKGLAIGERIVVSGNFLVDSESRMKASVKTRDVISPPPGGTKERYVMKPASPGPEGAAASLMHQGGHRP